MSETLKKFHVLIVGGGIGGLALANSLELAGISYTLLERRGEIAPQVGASIAILPNGGRIMDQFGCFEALLHAVEPLRYAVGRYPSGDAMPMIRDGPQLSTARSGIPMFFLDRQKVLEIMYMNLKNKSQVLLNKSVEQVLDTGTGVRVVCKDGTYHDGHIVVGCDGVNSKIRQEMWKAADEQAPGTIPASDKKALTAEYSCIFGISSKTPGMSDPGTVDIGYCKDRSTITIINKGHRTYWFLYNKLDRVYGSHEIPTYSKEDARRVAKDAAPFHLTPNTDFGDIFERAESYNLVALEKARFTKWTFGPFVCVGDSISKMTPNAGAGGNSAIESAAALTNELKRLVGDQTNIPTRQATEAALLRYEQVRRFRAHGVSQTAAFVTRMHAMRSIFHRLFVYHIIPWAGDYFLDLQDDMHCGAVMLDFVSPPSRSLTGNMPFNPTSGIAAKESRSRRFLWGLPMLLIPVAAVRLLKMDVTDVIMRQAAVVHLGSTGIPLANVLGTLISPLGWNPMGMTFVHDGGSPLHWQRATYLADYGVIYTILLIESGRRANALTVLQMPIVFGILSQAFGIGSVAAVWLFLAWPFLQIDNFKSTDNRLTDRRISSTALAAMCLAYYLPAVVQHVSTSPGHRETCICIWQLFPFTVGFMQRLVAAGFVPDTLAFDRLHKPLRDLPAIVVQVAISGVASAVAWLSTMAGSPYTVREMFLPTWQKPDGNAGGLAVGHYYLKWDEVLAFAGFFTWLGYCFWDLKGAGLTQWSFAALGFTAVVSVTALGPGATFALGWGYREYCLAYRRHKDAVVMH